MVGKKNYQQRLTQTGEKVQTFAIRKVKGFVTSVAITTGIFFVGGQGIISAEENVAGNSHEVATESGISEGNQANPLTAVEPESKPDSDSKEVSIESHGLNENPAPLSTEDRKANAVAYALEGQGENITTLSPKEKNAIADATKNGIQLLPIGVNNSNKAEFPNGYDSAIPYHDGTDGWYTFVQLRGASNLGYMYNRRFFDGNIVISVKSQKDNNGGYLTDGTGIIEVYRAGENKPFQTISFKNEEGNGEFVYEEYRYGFLKKKVGYKKNLLTWNKDSVSIGDQPYKARATEDQMANFNIAFNYPEVFVKNQGPFYADGWVKPRNHQVNVIYKDIDTGEELAKTSVNGLTGMKYTTKRPDTLPGGYKYVSSSETKEGYLSPWNKVNDTLTKRTQPNLDIKYTLLDMTGKMKWELFYSGEKKAEGTLQGINDRSQSYTGIAQNGRQYTQYIENPFLPKANDIIHYYRKEKKPAEVTVEYYDETTKQLLETTQPFTGASGSQVSYSTQDKVNAYKAKGYELVKNDFPSDPKFGQPGEKKVYRVVLKHGTETITETKDVNRVIHYRKDNKKGEVVSPDVKQVVTFERSVVIDKVTKGRKEEKYVARPSNTLSKVDSPQIANYTPDRASVAEVVPTADTKDLEEWVIYTGDAKVLVDYKDQDDNGRILESKTDLPSGKAGEKVNYSTQETIKKYENKGYEKVSDNFPNEAKYGKAGAVDRYEVILKHKKETLNPQNPGKPGEKINPNDPDPKAPTYPQGTDKAYLEKVVKQTIHYVYEDGKPAHPDHNDSVRFEREVVIDKVTGKILEDKGFKAINNDTTFDAVSSPEIKGYTPDQAEVPAVSGLTKDSKDRVVTVIYKKKEEPKKPETPAKESQKAIIKYIDDAKVKTFTPDTVTGESGSKIDYTTTARLNDLKKQGYKLVSDGFTKEGGQHFDKDSKKDQEFEVHVTPRIEPVTPDKAIPNPGDKVNPEDPNTPVWPNSVKGIENRKTITRTIRYWKEKVNGEKAFEDKVQTVEFTRPAYVNLVTGEVKYGDWTSNNNTYPEVKSPYLKGYTEDKAKISSAQVTVDDKDSVEDVVYTPANEERTPEQPKPVQPKVEVPTPEQPKPFVPEKPVTPGHIVPGVVEVPTPGQPRVVVPTPEQPTVPVQPTPVQPTPVQPTPVQPTPVQPTPVQPTPVQPVPEQPEQAKPADQIVPGETPKTPTDRPAVPVQGAKNRLPQTGEKEVATALTLGMASVMASSILMGTKKREA